jgi:carbon monoxide dehydrogenase subunit G
MEFTNSFTVAAPIDVVYRYLQQVEEVAPCVPGAQITDRTDDHHFQGSVKVKLGAVQMTFRGDLELTSDGSSKTIVLTGKGRELRGGSGASGTVTAQLSGSDDGGTRVELLSRVDVSGRLAQFGRSIIPDVAGRLIHEFATCLEAKLTQHGESEVADVLDIGHATADAVKARGKEFMRGLARRKDTAND